MAQNDYVIGIGMGLDPSGLKDGLAEAKREMTLAASEFEKNAGWSKEWDKSIEGVQAKISQMATEMEAKKRVVELWRQELQRVTEVYGENSKEAMETETKLNKAEASYSKAAQYTENLKKQLKELEEQDGETAESTDGLTGAIDGSADAADQASSGGFGRLKEGLVNLRDKVVDGLKNKLTEFARETLQTGMDFTSTMSEVQAISGATGDELAELTKTAREYGASTTFSATESAEALKYMALAGWDTQQSTEALGGVLDLAAASGMSLGNASDMVTDYITAFGLEAKDAASFADMLAYAQANSNTTAEGLGEAFRNCAANMSASGQTVETTTAVLAKMADAGLKGSQAGTSLSAIMRDITKKMEEGEIAIGETTVSVVDAEGNFRSLTEILRGVEEAVDGMGTAEAATALQTTFTADSIKGMNLILGQGVDEVASFESALHGADGSAKAMADTMNDNLAGDMKKLQSAVDEMKLKLFDLLEGPLRGIVNFVSDNLPLVIGLVGAVGGAFAAWKVGSVLKEMMDGVKALLPMLASLASGTALATAAEVAHTAASTAMAAAQGVASAATTALSGAMTFLAANPIVLVIAAIAAIAVALYELYENCEWFRDAIDGIWDAIVGFFEWAYDSICGLFEPLVEFFEGIWDGIKGAFGGVADWFGGVADSAVGFFEDPWGSVTGFFGGIWDGIQKAFSGVADWFGGVADSAVKFFEDPWGGIKGFFGGVWDSITHAFDGALSFFGISSKDMRESFQTGWGMMKDFFGNVWDGIKGAFRDPIGTFTGIANSMKNGLESAWNGISSFFGDIWAKIKAPFEGIGNWFSSTFGGVVSAIKAPFEGIYNFFKGIWDKIAGIFQPVLSFFGLGGGSKSDPLKEKREEVDRLKQAFDSAQKVYSSAQDEWLDANRNFGYGSGRERNAYTAYSYASTALTQASQAYSKAKKDLEDAEASASSGSSGLGGITSSIQKAFSGITDIITKPFTAALDAIKSIFGGIGSWFSDNVVGPIGNALGGIVGGVTDVIGGVAEGIANGAGGVVSGVKEFGENVFNGFKSFFGIHSPSKLMRDKVGLMLGEGVAEGIRDSIGAVERASAELSGAVGINGSAVAGGSAAGGTVVFNQTINSPDPLSAGQIYRDTRSLLGRRGWAA